MANKDQFTAKQFIEAIPGTGGIVSAIAKKVGCTWHTAKKYIDKHPTIKQAYEDECEAVLDMTETQAIKAIKKGDGPMIRYMLSTKGKHRGYVERVENKQVDEVVFTVKYDKTGRGSNVAKSSPKTS